MTAKFCVRFFEEASSDLDTIKKHLERYYSGTTKRFFSLLQKKYHSGKMPVSYANMHVYIYDINSVSDAC